MKKVTTLVTSFMIIFAALLSPLAVSQSAYADGVDVFKEACQNTNSELCRNNEPLFGAGSIWMNLINTLIFIIGAVAVLMIVIGGLKYVMSGGDQAAVNSAKNTILYSVIGLVVAILANAIVNFTINAL